MRSVCLSLLLGLFLLGAMSTTAEAGHGYRVRYRHGYYTAYGVPAYYVPVAPVVVAPVVPYGTPFYDGPYYAPGVYGGPSPFIHPRRAYYYGVYGW